MSYTSMKERLEAQGYKVNVNGFAIRVELHLADRWYYATMRTIADLPQELEDELIAWVVAAIEYMRREVEQDTPLWRWFRAQGGQVAKGAAYAPPSS